MVFMLELLDKIYSFSVNCIKFLITPKSVELDSARREFILNVLLAGSIILSLIATISAFLGEVIGSSTKGSTIKVFSVFLIFILAYFASRKGQARLVSYVLVIVYLLVTTYSSYLFGADVPQDILTYALIIVMSGILLGSLFAFSVTIVTALILFVLTYLQSHHLIIISSAWKNNPTNIRDAIVYDVTLFVIALVSWLFNHEMEKALKRARESESALQKQKGQLEVLVEERTQELQQAQIEKLTQLYRFVEFGREASGLFHDLVNPLNIVLLNLDQLNERSKKITQKEMKVLIGTAIQSTKKLESYVLAARKQLQNQEELQFFSLRKEIMQVIQILNYKIKISHVRVMVTGKNTIKTFNNSIKFNQLMMNLITNAIDAYDGSEKSDKTITIVLEKNMRNITITIKDFACGIRPEHLSKIFDPLFTTKNFEKGTGIGLAISRNIIEKSFKGTIRVKSFIGKGTLFTIKFPIQNPPSGEIKREKKN